MKRPKSEEYIFYQGEKFQVEFYFDEKGEMPAKQYYDLASCTIQLKLLALVKRMAEHGKIYDETKFRIVDKSKKIYEFKPNVGRFFNFFCKGQKIIITNAYHKKGQKVNQQELDRAIDLKEDYEVRENGGDYYG